MNLVDLTHNDDFKSIAEKCNLNFKQLAFSLNRLSKRQGRDEDLYSPGDIHMDGDVLYIDNNQDDVRTYLQSVEGSDHNLTRVGTHRKVNDTDIYNNLNLRIDNNGNRTVTVSEVAPWLDMLGLTVSDTTMSVGTAASTVNSNHVRRTGKVVTIEFTGLKLASALANATTSGTLLTIPSGYRPSWNIYFGPVAHTANLGSSYYRIDTNGNVTVRNQSGSSFTTSYAMAGTVTYVIA